MVVARHKRVYHHWYDKIRLFICGHQVTYLHTTFLCASTRSKRKKEALHLGTESFIEPFCVIHFLSYNVN